MEKLQAYSSRLFQQIQQSVKTENSHGTRTIVNQVEDFISKVRSIPDELKENNRPIEEEKALVVNCGKTIRRNNKDDKKP